MTWRLQGNHLAWRSSAPVAILVFLSAACGRAPARTPWNDEAGHRWRSLDLSTRGKAGFTRVAAGRSGVDFQNYVSDSAAFRNRILVQGGGVAVGDLDGDERPDLVLARTEGPSAVYRNRGGMRFEDVTSEAGVDTRNRAATGVALADVDGDRDLDLLLSALGGPNALFLNDGRGRFTEDTSYPGRSSRAGSTTLALADVEGDGDLDLYVTNYKAYTALDRYTPQERAFDQIVRRTGERQFEVIDGFKADFKTVLRDDLRGVSMVQRADPDWFYLNDGSGRFSRIAMAGSERFVDEDGRALTEEREDFGLAGRFYDVTGDGAPELYVANDFEDPDQFWVNDGKGSFRLIARTGLRTTSNSGMAVDFGDVNRDGLPDLFEVDMLSWDSRALKTQIPTHTALPKQPGVYLDRPQLQRNTLFLNRGDGTFAQIAELAGLDRSGWTWSTMLVDVDLDGFEDVLTATGHPWDLMDADTQEKLRNRLTNVDWFRQRYLYPKLALPNYAFRNRGDLTFEDVSETWGFSAGPDISHGMATGDLDGDGDQDVVINRLGAPALVLRNETVAPRISVRLRGQPPNTYGIGARVRVLGGAAPLQEREVTAGGLYLSHSDHGLSFATGRADTVTIEVRWRNGRVSIVPGARANREYEVFEDQAAATGPDAPETRAPGPRPVPLFEDLTELLSHRHTEPAYDEARRQLLLPNAFSQLGPGVTWYDVDEDGDDDLLIGAGRTGTLALYRNDRGRLTATELGIQAEGDFTTILGLPTPAGTTLLLGQSSYEAPDPSAAVAMPSVLAVPLDRRGRPRGPPKAAVPGDSGSVGPLALADYDRDGDLDLFVGARLMPGAYPLSPSSRLFRNDGQGRFELDQPNSALLRHLGMVSAALWSDLDTDGDVDLLLAVEWGPLKLFLNTGGRLQPAPASWGLSGLHSRWFGLASGDFDGDGRPELITTSWGRNTRPRVDSVRPLYLYFGNFDPNGSLDLLLAQDDPRLGRVAPLTSFARLSRAVPSIAERLRTFSRYAEASVDVVLGPSAARALRLGVQTLDHLHWRQHGQRFVPRPLPVWAQMAPAVAPVVGDFTGDGRADLVLSQNFFPTELGTPRYDAGRGLVLVNDGRGGFTPVEGPAAGLMLYGDQRGAAAADLDQDGRLDVAVAQNGAETGLFRNLGAAPGVRVRLEGPLTNPQGIGAQLRLKGPSGAGPLWEVQAGSGYWSSSSPVLVLGPATSPATVEVRWPTGQVTETPVAGAGRTVTVTFPR